MFQTNYRQAWDPILPCFTFLWTLKGRTRMVLTKTPSPTTQPNVYMYIYTSRRYRSLPRWPQASLLSWIVWAGPGPLFLY